MLVPFGGGVSTITTGIFCSVAGFCADHALGHPKMLVIGVLDSKTCVPVVTHSLQKEDYIIEVRNGDAVNIVNV